MPINLPNEDVLKAFLILTRDLFPRANMVMYYFLESNCNRAITTTMINLLEIIGDIVELTESPINDRQMRQVLANGKLRFHRSIFGACDEAWYFMADDVFRLFEQYKTNVLSSQHIAFISAPKEQELLAFFTKNEVLHEQAVRMIEIEDEEVLRNLSDEQCETALKMYIEAFR